MHQYHHSSIHPSIPHHISINPFIHAIINISIFNSFIHPPIHLFVYFHNEPFMHPFIHSSTHPFIHPSIHSSTHPFIPFHSFRTSIYSFIPALDSPAIMDPTTIQSVMKYFSGNRCQRLCLMAIPHQHTWNTTAGSKRATGRRYRDSSRASVSDWPAEGRREGRCELTVGML